MRPLNTVFTTAALLVGALPALAAERALDKAVTVPASLDATWAAWTTREGITSFFAPDAKVEARAGGPFQIYFDPGAAPGLKGADDMRFLAVQPRKMISFDWNAPPSLPEARAQRTFVVVRFEAQGPASTRVTLHHTGWGDGGEWDRAHAYFDRAWGAVLGNLEKRFTQGPMDWGPWLKQLDDMRVKTAATAPAAPPAAPATAGVPEAMLAETRADAARRAGVPEAQVSLRVAEAVTWRDGGLGCAQPDRVYTQALVPGWNVVWLAAGRDWHFHASRRGNWTWCPSERVQPPLAEGGSR